MPDDTPPDYTTMTGAAFHEQEIQEALEQYRVARQRCSDLGVMPIAGVGVLRFTRPPQPVKRATDDWIPAITTIMRGP